MYIASMANASNNCTLIDGRLVNSNATLVVSLSNSTARIVCTSKIYMNEEIIIAYGKSYHSYKLIY